MDYTMFGLFNLSGGELILFVLVLMGAGIFGLVRLAVWAATRLTSSPRAVRPAVPPRPCLPRGCPRCGTPLPPDAPEGLCPRCVLGVGLAHTEATADVGAHGTKVIQPPLPAEDLARYFPQLEIMECLGRGGMGVVYKARQPKLNRLVALKILAPEKGADPKFAERFLREAQALARLNHPNIVTVHDFGETDGLYYLLMEYVDGMTLRQLLQGQKIAPEQALSIVPKICEALQFAHEQGVVHRDIKPENVLLDKQGRVKIADFGIAKMVAAEHSPQAITQDQVVGTPHYMAPEQVEKPQSVDHRADIYSLGVVFYEMLTGELPLGKFQPPSKKVQVDVRLDQVVLHALEKEPERRYQHASEVKSDVETIVASPAPAAPGAPSAPPEATERRATCYFSTPERMRNCFPSAAAQIYICKGELRLGTEALTFITPWQTRVVIPLQDIAELGIGQFQMWTTPWVMQYERVNFLALNYSKDGRKETVYLTPVPPGATSARLINDCIGEWFGVIQEAIVGRTGAAPGALQPRAVTVSAEPSWNRKGVPLFIGLLAAFGLLVWRFRSVFGSSPEPLGILLLGTVWLLLMAVIWFSIGFLRANYAIKHGDLDAVTRNEPPESLQFAMSAPGVKPVESRWIIAARWNARGLGTLLLAFYGLFVLGEGLPPIGSQPEGVQISFVGVGLMLLGFVIGWKREGTAALLIASGWTLWHIAEGRITFGAFQMPLPVAALYAFCWWATRGRRTGVVLTTIALLAVALTLGQLFAPTSVFVHGVVLDAGTGKPIPKAELTLERAAGGPRGEKPSPNARAGKDGRFTLYVGWYTKQKGLSIAAPGYTTQATNLGPRALGQRSVSRDYRLQPAGELDRKREVLRVRLQQAEADAARLKELAEGGRVSASELEGAQYKVELLKADLEDDPERAARIRLAAAERQLQRASDLWNAGRISTTAYEAAKADVRVRQAEAQGASSADLVGGFSPVNEATVYTDWQTAKIRVLDLDDGRSLDVPKTVVMASANNPRPMLNWMVQHRADLTITSGDSPTSLGLHLDDGRLIRMADSIAFDDIAASAAGLERQLALPTASQDLRLTKVEAGAWPVIAFKTREGGVGVLQVLQFTNSPCAVRLRHKQIVGGLGAATPSIFGPVIERVLNDPDDRQRDETLRLVTGDLSSELTGAKKLGGGRILRLMASTGDLYAEFDDYVGGRWGLITAGLKLADLSPGQWETATPTEVRRALETPTVVPHVTEYGAILYLLPEGLSPMTFGFRTRNGDYGLLQVTGFTDNPRGVKLRYKLVMRAENPTR